MEAVCTCQSDPLAIVFIRIGSDFIWPESHLVLSAPTSGDARRHGAALPVHDLVDAPASRLLRCFVIHHRSGYFTPDKVSRILNSTVLLTGLIQFGSDSY